MHASQATDKDIAGFYKHLLFDISFLFRFFEEATINLKNKPNNKNMRKLLLLSFFLVMAIAGRAQAYLNEIPDFTAVDNGVTYYCKIIDETNRKVLIVNPHNGVTFPSVQTLIVPEKLTAPSGIEYTVTAFGQYAISNNYPNMVEAIFPKTLEHMGYFAVFPDRNWKRVTIQALKTFFDFVFWGGNSSLGYYVEEVRMLMTTPPRNIHLYNGFFDFRDIANEPYRIILPLECTYLYKAEGSFKYQAKEQGLIENYYEELKIGPNGYTSYYLEHENFEVPTGSTAYIIKGATNRLNHTGDAVVEAFPAGSIIPKQTGFILSGTPGITVAYRA